jgi:hypothetical protein
LNASEAKEEESDDSDDYGGKEEEDEPYDETKPPRPSKYATVQGPQNRFNT